MEMPEAFQVKAEDNHCQEPGCGRVFDTTQGLAMHMSRSHKPKAHDADEVFERIGAATDALFPDGVPTSRIIEIADLQKAMLKVVQR